MAFGPRARNPETSYLVYALSWREKVFYIGICQSESTRHTHRWKYVCNLLKHESNRTLKPDKKRELYRKSNAVIAALQRGNYEDKDYVVIKLQDEISGRRAAEKAEAKFIASHLAEKCVLANSIGLSEQFSIGEILNYLDVDIRASQTKKHNALP